ncbi:MAG TPA: cytochrome c [Cyclobacteriaceae bacterium]|nr:cytochrome c [Cyclobacteriaceae bacterium]
MIRKILKGLAIFIGVIVVLAVGFYTKVYFSTRSRMNHTYAITPQKISISTDSSVLALGKHYVETKGCQDCHGADLGGKIFVDDPALGLLVARNLTKGNGGLPKDHNVDDWVLALKHGIRRNGKPLLFMPSHEYTHLSEGDMSAIISYCLTLKPVDRELPQSNLGFLARILTDLGKLPLLPVEMIDHDRTLIKEVKAEVTADYGKYLSISCIGCHRENLKGGEPVAPGYPVVADISSTGNPGRWTVEQFMNTLRTGETPEGKKLDPSQMPWTMTKGYTDTELKALFTYLRSI